MTRSRLLMAGAAILVVAAVTAVVFLRRGGGVAEAEPTPTAIVTLAPVGQQALQDVVEVYGVVQADPAGSLTVAAPKAAIVTGVRVRVGQVVSAGEALAVLANAPATEMAYRQASDAARFAETDLARVQRLYDDRLAGGDQLTAAKKTLGDAQAALAAQRAQGAGQAGQVITAQRSGVVTSVTATVGDHVAQDAPLMVLARQDGAVAKLGLEPGMRVSPGEAVTIEPVAGGASISSRLAMVGRAADPATKMVDAVAPLGGAALPIGSAVRARIATGGHPGLAAPRAAVVFDETGPHVFVVSKGAAHRVFVTVGQDHGDQIEVSGSLPAGAQVAVEGAYELQDGMAVKVRAK